MQITLVIGRIRALRLSRGAHVVVAIITFEVRFLFVDLSKLALYLSHLVSDGSVTTLIIGKTRHPYLIFQCLFAHPRSSVIIVRSRSLVLIPADILI